MPAPGKLSSWIYRRLIGLYPQAFRDEFAPSLLSAFEVRWEIEVERSMRLGGMWCWLLVLRDLLVSVPRERMAAWSGTPGSSGGGAFADLTTELRQVARSLWRRPGFSVVAILTLTLGLGASTAIFSVVHGVLLRPLPYPDSEDLVTIRSTNSEWQISEVPRFRNLWDRGYSVSMMDYRDWLLESRTLAAIGAYQEHDFVYSGDGETTVRVAGVHATAGLFSALGVEPQIGRVLSLREDQLGADRAVVLSHGLWVRAFGSDPAALERPIRLDGESYNVVGVMPAGFYFPESDAQFWTNFGDEAKQRPRGWGDLSVLARLEDGISIDAARTDMSVLAARIGEANPDGNNGDDVRITSRLVDVVGETRPRLRLLTGAVALVLLIACVNLANLLLVRATERSGELAVRTALGSSKWRLVRHVLLESMTLAMTGGVLGVLLAWYLVASASTLLPADIPRLEEIRLDGTVLVFSLVTTLLTGLVTGLLPALQVGATAVGTRLREAATEVGAGKRKALVQQGLVVAEISAAFALLIGSGVMVKSLIALTSVERGFEAENVATVQVDLPEWSYPEQAGLQGFASALVDRLNSMPGVTAAGAAGAIPLADPGGYGPVIVLIDGNREVVDVGQGVVTPGYFEALGISVSAGRTFERADQGAELRVVVVSEAGAASLWPGQDPIGNQVYHPRSEELLTVVGVVANVRHENLTAPPGPHIYTPSWIQPPRTITAVVRTELGGEDALAATREAIRQLDPNLAISRAATLSGIVRRSVAVPRFQAWLLGALAAVAFALAVGGIFGVVSYSVERRTAEIGLRIALGARRGRILVETLRGSFVLCLTGLAVGQGIVWLTGSVMERFLFDVAALDVQVIVMAAVLMVGTAMLASGIPAWRASGVDPVSALRSE